MELQLLVPALGLELLPLVVSYQLELRGLLRQQELRVELPLMYLLLLELQALLE
jgi:hypothetical protein